MSESTGYSGVVVVVPTRNRAELAMNAIRSVMDQAATGLRLLVSHNSTSEHERSTLASFCNHLADPRLTYLGPTQPLPMAAHWDWVMQEALSLYDVSHFTFLTDRMMFKPEAFKPLLDILAWYPSKIVSYMHDIVDDSSIPVVVRQFTWTGNLYDVSSKRLLELSAQSVIYDSSMPRMLNCLVPRRVLDAIARRFGNIFAPIAPDWAFCYRALALEDSILHHDKAALVHYAQDRSNGQSLHHGIMNEAYTAFTQDLGPTRLNFAAPYPEIITIWNAIISEYCHAKQVTQSLKFPEVDLDNYKSALAWGVAAIRDPQRRDDMEELLSARGWRATEPGDASSAAPRASIQEIASGVDTFSVNNVEFQDASVALNYALHKPRPKSAGSNHETLIQGIKKPLP